MTKDRWYGFNRHPHGEYWSTGRGWGERPAYATIVESIQACVDQISRAFDQWNDQETHGSGLYIDNENHATIGFTEPMGTNRWPVEDCPSGHAAPVTLLEAATDVANACDGAIQGVAFYNRQEPRADDVGSLAPAVVSGDRSD